MRHGPLAASRPPVGHGLEPYKAGLPYTYAFGHFTALEALKHRPADVRAVLVHGALEPHWRRELERSAERAGVPCERDDAGVARLRRHDQVRCLAVVSKALDAVLPERDHAVLVAAGQAGNVGSALRSLAAFGIDDVVMVAPKVDAWSPHVLRASVGMRFAMRCQALARPADYLAAHPNHRVYSFSASGDAELGSVEFRSPFALWFGPEWPGAGAPDEPPPGLSVRIASRPLVESLNLAVAVSLAAYAAGRGKGRTNDAYEAAWE